MRAACAVTALIAGLVAGCSADQPAAANQSAAAAPAAPATPAAPALPTGEEGVRRYAECASTLNAVAILYSVIASQRSGAEAEEMHRISSARNLAALDFEIHADTLRREVPNAPLGQVRQLMSARRDALEQERERQPFEDFAIWLGREADQCAAIAPPAI